MKGLRLEVGRGVTVRGRIAQLVQVIDLDRYLLRFESGELRVVGRAEIDEPAEPEKPLRAWDDYTPKEIEEAHRWFEALRPILDRGVQRGDMTSAVDAAAAKLGVHRSTVYHRLEGWDGISPMSLLPSGGTGQRGRPRMNDERSALLDQIVRKHYLTRDQLSPTIVYREHVVPGFAKAGLKPPAKGTIYKRIHELDSIEVIEARQGKRAARDARKQMLGEYPFATAPLSSVQIDYWRYDIEIVDELTRQPIGRPWLAMTIDTFSFMPTGYYLSLDPPGASSAGLAVFHSITRKEKWLASLGVDMDWPVWGLMRMIHADNAKEFRGTMLRRFVVPNDTELVNRKIKTPRYGPHIERYFGKLAYAVKHVPGATGSNIKERSKKRDPRKSARLTLRDLELYLLSVIKEHINTPHTTLGVTPLQRWRSYFFDDNGRQIAELFPEVDDLDGLRKELLPVNSRTLQAYGIQWDLIRYDSDALVALRQRYASEPEQKFSIRRDPRDISEIYVWDPDNKVHLTVPARNTNSVPMSIWEQRAAKQEAERRGLHVGENEIFDIHKEISERNQRLLEAGKETVKVRRSRQQRAHHKVARAREAAVIKGGSRTLQTLPTPPAASPPEQAEPLRTDVYDDLDI